MRIRWGNHLIAVCPLRCGCLFPPFTLRRQLAGRSCCLIADVHSLQECACQRRAVPLLLLTSFFNPFCALTFQTSLPCAFSSLSKVRAELAARAHSDPVKAACRGTELSSRFSPPVKPQRKPSVFSSRRFCLGEPGMDACQSLTANVLCSLSPRVFFFLEANLRFHTIIFTPGVMLRDTQCITGSPTSTSCSILLER